MNQSSEHGISFAGLGVKPGEWRPHTCTAETVPDPYGCAGCKQRDELKIQPVSKHARARTLERERIERGPKYAMVGVGAPDRNPGIWLGSCEWCGSLVIAAGNGIDDQRPIHTKWHQDQIWTDRRVWSAIF